LGYNILLYLARELRWEDDVRNDLRKMGGEQLETKDAGEEVMERDN
jgi:hypothetical protein